MTVKELSEIIANMPGDAKVLVPSSDHSYRDADGMVTTALYLRRRGWTEDYGEEHTPEAEYGKRMTVLVID